MGTRWGVNRSVAQIHALLYLAERPLNAEEIAAALNVARSNVSTSLKELMGWGLARVVHVADDRRDHFVASQDVWEIFRIIVTERRRRELDPTLTVLRECLLERATHREEQDLQKKIGEVLAFLETLTGWSEQMLRLSPKTLAQIMRMGARIERLLQRDGSRERAPGRPR
jgi:DNA-binding transcriptional regulator GbsR (MarR family)